MGTNKAPKAAGNTVVVVKTEIVSTPGSRVVETQYTLSDDMIEQMRVHTRLPSAPAPASDPESAEA